MTVVRIQPVDYSISMPAGTAMMRGRRSSGPPSPRPGIYATKKSWLFNQVPASCDAGVQRIMSMLSITIPDPDWVIIRQALSLALVRSQPITIGEGAAFFDAHREYRPLFEDLTRFAAEIGAGRPVLADGTILYEPRPVSPRRTHFGTGPHSSAVELLLFLMPALFHADFRSILEFSGVTHSPLSTPTAFVKETLLGALERLGFYGSVTLKRFGFYGSGGGAMEARVYPRESAPPAPSAGGRVSLAGAKIFISRLDTGLAELEKSMIAERVGIEPGRIGIIEVLESDGAGNGIQVYAESGGLPIVISREMRLFSETGEIILNEEALRAEIEAVAGEVRSLRAGTLPERFARELLPYYMLCGMKREGAEDSPRIAATRGLCELML